MHCDIFLSFCHAALSKEERLQRDLEQIPKRRRGSDEDREEHTPRELGKALTADDGRWTKWIICSDVKASLFQNCSNAISFCVEGML